MEEQPYTFTTMQLRRLLNDTIGMFLEYRDQHEKTEHMAQIRAVAEMFEGLDAERELVTAGDMVAATSQLFTIPA